MITCAADWAQSIRDARVTLGARHSRYTDVYMDALSQSSRHGHSHPWALSSELPQLGPKPAGLTGEFLIDSEILYDASCESVGMEDANTQVEHDSTKV